MKRRCPKCGTEWEIKGPVGFREECPECAVFVHTCLNCRHYDARNKGCRLPTTDSVRDREEINFCEEFDYGVAAADAPPARPDSDRPAPPARPANGSTKAEDARRKFEDLFRDPKK